MDPATALLIANSAITILRELSPEIMALINKGEITVEQQNALKQAIDDLKTHLHDNFSSPEWEITPS